MPPPIALKKMAVLWLRFLTEIDKTTEEAPAELIAKYTALTPDQIELL